MADGQAPVHPLVSILMPCCGELEYTRLSVPRVMRYSRPPFEVVFVDAGSLDGTSDYLAGVAAVAPVRVDVVRSEREADFPRLLAQALASARGDLVAWLNNDMLVPELWLQQLVALVSANEVMGVVGPMSNVAPEQQRVPGVAYRLIRPRALIPGQDIGQSLETQVFDRFAQQLRQAQAGQWAQVEGVGGFCWLSKREVLSRVGLLEKGADDGVFDAGRFSASVRRSGFHMGCCRDLYVHHFGRNLLHS